MALTKVSGGVIQPDNFSVGVITATSLNAAGVVTASTVQVGSGTTIHDAGIDLGSGNITSHNINSTGIVTSTGLDVNGNGDISGDLSVSGNVSIGGTLTYEDVTNIDSVGLITARDGIIVTGGSIGINTTVPAEKLDVWGTIRASAGTQQYMHMYPVEGAGYFDVSNSTTYPSIVFRQIGSGGTQERLRIDSSGNIGIGTNNPTKKLEVAGNEVSFSPNTAGKHTHLFTTNASDDGRYLIKSDTTTVVDIQANGSSYFNGGNIGIGTDNPGDLLTLYGTDPSIKLQDSSGDAFSLIEGDNTDEGSLRFRADPLSTGANTHIRFDTDGSERLRITSNGNLGLGTDSPLSFTPTLQISGTDPALLLHDTATTVDYFGANVTSGIAQFWYDDAATLTINTASGLSGVGLSEKLRIDSSGKLCLHNVGSGAEAAYGRLEILHYGVGGVDPNTSYLSFHRTANTAFQMGIVDNKFVLGVTGGAARDDVQTPHVVFDPTGTDTILGLGTTIPNGKGLDITHSRTNTYSQTSDQRNLAHLILRNGSDAPDRFTSLSMVNGGGTQAEGSINLVQNGNYRGHFAFKLRHSSGSTDWMERFRIGTDGELIQYSYGSYIRHYTTTTNSSLYRTHVAMSMQGNTAYEFRFAGAGNGIVWIRTMASHWTLGYGLVRESYCFMDSYAGLSESNQYSLTSSTQGSWSFSRPSSGQTGYQSHLVINKSAGSYGGGMTGLIILESDRPFVLVSIT